MLSLSPRSITIGSSRAVTHARTASSIGTPVAYLSGRKSCRARGRQYPRRKSNFGESFTDRGRGEERGGRAVEVNEPGRNRPSRDVLSTIARRRATTDYRVSSRPTGRETSLGIILLRMNYGTNRYSNGRLRRCRGHGESHYVNYTRRRYCPASFSSRARVRYSSSLLARPSLPRAIPERGITVRLR